MKDHFLDVGNNFDKPEDVDLATALQMIRVGIVPTEKIEAVGTVYQLHGDIPIRSLGERTREQFLKAILRAGLDVEAFKHCPESFKFEAIEAVNKAHKTQ